MSIEYEWNKEDLKKELIKSRKKTNIIFFIIGILMFIYFTYYALISKAYDNKYIIGYGIGYIALLLAILLISTKIYVASRLRKNSKDTSDAYGLYKLIVDDKCVSVSINDLKIKYDYKDIVKIKKKKDKFQIFTKEDKIGLTFKKSVLGEENYNKLLECIQKNIQ